MGNTITRLGIAVTMSAWAALASAQGAPPPGGPAGGPPGGGAGGPPPGGGMMQPQPESAADKERRAVVEGFGALIDAGKVDEAFDKYISKDFVEHSYMARRMGGKDKMGFADVKPFFQKFMVGSPQSPGKLVDTLAVNDEMVTYRGRKGQDIFRVVNGKITDHWDTLQAQGAGGAGGPPGGGAGGPPGPK